MRFWEVMGARLRELRFASGLSRNDVAMRVGTFPPNVSRAEKGTHALSLETLERYARALGTTPIALLEHVYAQGLSTTSLPTDVPEAAE